MHGVNRPCFEYEQFHIFCAFRAVFFTATSFCCPGNITSRTLVCIAVYSVTMEKFGYAATVVVLWAGRLIKDAQYARRVGADLRVESNRSLPVKCYIFCFRTCVGRCTMKSFFFVITVSCTMRVCPTPQFNQSRTAGSSACLAKLNPHTSPLNKTSPYLFRTSPHPIASELTKPTARRNYRSLT